jgi:hypothetical protein
VCVKVGCVRQMSALPYSKKVEGGAKKEVIEAEGSLGLEILHACPSFL